MVTRRSPASVVLAAVVVAVCAPLSALCGISAAYFALRQFANGWIPSRWVSDSPADWVFGTGVKGDAGNYLGLMLSAVPAAALWSAVKWALTVLRSRTD